MNAIEMKNVSKTYPGFTLKNFSLTLPAGCILGLVGENGAGKSTVINLIMNAVNRDSGTISVLGRDNKSKEFTYAKEEIGIVLDEAYFPEVLTSKHLNEIMKRTYKTWREKNYFDYIKDFSLPLDKPFKDYSRGMKMKLAIAVALSHAPKLLVLDEATSGLDPIVRDEILDIFNDFTREEDHSILLSSHITSDLEKICDYIAFIHKGELIFCEEKDLLLEQYAIIRLPKEALKDIPPTAVLGVRHSNYASEVLVKKSGLPNKYTPERATVEEIVLLLVKGGKGK